MKRILLALLLLGLPLAARADGMVIPTIAYPAHVTIPDQRALICFSNGMERLVIETRFTGAGTNFAWVVPLPSQPVIEEATTGLFPTLQYLFRPQIIHEVPQYYMGILAAVGFVFLLWRATRSVWNGLLYGGLLFALVVILALMLLPGFAAAKKGGMEASSSPQAVSMLDRKLVGIFETTTISSHDPEALENWLRENGFLLPTSASPVIASYVKDGWVFVATKVRRDDAKPDASTPHPVSFTFKTDKPVYPMRLTGVDNDRVNVELYVFGPARAEAPHFNVERCTQPNYPEPPPPDTWSWNWRRRSPETPEIVHPLLRKWVAGSSVATKLTARLSPAQMRQDVWIDWIPFSEKKNFFFTSAGAQTIALNWSAGIWAGSLLTACLFSISTAKRRPHLTKYAGMITVCCMSLTGLIYLVLPKIEARLEKDPLGTMENMLFSLSVELSEDVTNHPSVAAARITAGNIIKIAQTNAPYWAEWSRSVHWADWRNYYLGGPLHEEDSPGNYTIREVNGQLQFVVYDAEGAEHIQAIGD